MDLLLWGIQLGQLESKKPTFVEYFSTFPCSFPFSVCREKGDLKWTTKNNDINEFITVGHSNWAIQSPRNPLWSKIFPPSHAGSLSLYAGKREP